MRGWVGVFLAWICSLPPKVSHLALSPIAIPSAKIGNLYTLQSPSLVLLSSLVDMLPQPFVKIFPPGVVPRLFFPCSMDQSEL